jgi:hypothetical protein
MWISRRSARERLGTTGASESMNTSAPTSSPVATSCFAISNAITPPPE